MLSRLVDTVRVRVEATRIAGCILTKASTALLGLAAVLQWELLVARKTYGLPVFVLHRDADFEASLPIIAVA